MDWIANWNRALDYLEAHLEGEIRLEELGRLAGCSGYHFQRMFSYIAGIPLGEYIRKRKMSRAAADLQRGERVLDTALKYGYESPTSFNRAFQAVHGVPPSAAQREGVVLKSFPRIYFMFVLKGAVEMEYQIIKKEAFRIVGFRTDLPSEVEAAFEIVPKFWGEMGAKLPQLIPLMDPAQPGVLGVSTCHQARDNHYSIAVASSQPVPEGMFEEEVPACTWAVFTGSGELPGAMQALQKRIVSEWLPQSGYEWAKAPDVEAYLSPAGDPAGVFQVWLPVVPQK